MKKDLTEIIIVLDESGSMASCKSTTISGYNEFISTQKKLKGDVKFTLVKFSDYYNVINDGVGANEVTMLDNGNYIPDGMTALLDAVGSTINMVGKRLSSTPEDERPEKVIMAVITDGEENRSHEFDQNTIANMVSHQKTMYSWEFIFIGADIDAWGNRIGIMNNANVSKDNMQLSFKGLSHFTASYRSNASYSANTSFNLSDQQLDADIDNLIDNSK